MTREELIKILEMDTNDIEADHANADRALLEFINDASITAAFNKIGKWYA